MSATMRAVGVRSAGKPDTLEILDMPIPEISGPDDILVRVKAIRVINADGIRAAGYSWVLETLKFPFIIGHYYAGVVSAVGDNVAKFGFGDAVYGITLGAGAAAEYVLITPKFTYSIAHKPASMSFAVAACFINGHTIVQTLLRADSELEGGLKWKTVLVPAALPVFGAGKLITTVSTAKVALVPQLLGAGVVDQIIDYQKQSPIKEIPKEMVDLLNGTTFSTLSFLPAMKPKTGLILNLTSKSGDHFHHDWPEVPWWLVKLANVMEGFFRWRAARWGVNYDHMFICGTEEDLNTLAKWVEGHDIKPIIGEIVKMDDLENVRRVCGLMYTGERGHWKLCDRN